MASPREKSTSNESAENCARSLRALADSTRLRIVRALQVGALTVSDLSNLLEIEIANTSHHLRVLYHAGLVETQRDGSFVYYSLSEAVRASRASKSLDLGCCELNLDGLKSEPA